MVNMQNASRSIDENLGLLYAVDAESNGSTPPEIVELSIVKIEGYHVQWPPLTWTIKPVKPIKAFATKIHGISDRDVAQASPLASVRDEIISMLKCTPLVAHNAHVDYKLLRRAFPNWQPTAVHDTLKLARQVAPRLDSYSLSSLIANFQIEDRLRRHGLIQPHRACYDAVVAGDPFSVLVEQGKNRGISIDQILRMSRIELGRDELTQSSLF